jgi:hypothetical protein
MLRAEESLFVFAFKPCEIPHFVRNDRPREFLKAVQASISRTDSLGLKTYATSAPMFCVAAAVT